MKRRGASPTYIEPKFTTKINIFLHTSKLFSKFASNKTEMTNKDWAVNLWLNGYNASFKDGDLSDLLDLKQEHDNSFEKHCEETTVGTDDQMDADLQWLGKAINFFIERGYIKN